MSANKSDISLNGGTIQEMVASLLDQRGEPVEVSEILHFVVPAAKSTDQTVRGELAKMKKAHFLYQPRRKFYELTSVGRKQLSGDPVAESPTRAPLQARSITLPVYEMTAGAGANGGVAYGDAVEYYTIDHVEIATIYDRHPDKPFVIEVVGDSMEADFSPGDRIIIEPLESGTQVPPAPGVYLVQIEDYYEIKQVERLPGNKLLLTPRNTYYRSYELEIGGEVAFQLVGKVYGKFKRY
ncbi:MAG: hypothetical protein RhofKO_25580 [Rhodothermales bacterium]